MTKIDRCVAITKISTEILASLNHEERESHLLDWWDIDESNPEFFNLSEQFRQSIAAEDDLASDIDDEKYDELIQLAIKSKYKGVKNSYLSKIMRKLIIGDYEVHGEVESLKVCPCCNYHTLAALGNYEICDLCNWEDIGISDLDTYSGPNHMTLREAKEVFSKKSGALPLDKWVKN